MTTLIELKNVERSYPLAGGRSACFRLPAGMPMSRRLQGIAARNVFIAFGMAGAALRIA